MDFRKKLLDLKLVVLNSDALKEKEWKISRMVGRSILHVINQALGRNQWFIAPSRIETKIELYNSCTNVINIIWSKNKSNR